MHSFCEVLPIFQRISKWLFIPSVHVLRSVTCSFFCYFPFYSKIFFQKSLIWRVKKDWCIQGKGGTAHLIYLLQEIQTQPLKNSIGWKCVYKHAVTVSYLSGFNQTRWNQVGSRNMLQKFPAYFHPCFASHWLPKCVSIKYMLWVKLLKSCYIIIKH